MTTKKTYKEFIDELHCKNDSPYDKPKDPRPYLEFKALQAHVANEIHDQMSSSKWYHEFKPEVYEVMTKTILLTLYFQNLKVSQEG